MINLRHIKFLAIIIFSLLLSAQSFADKKFKKGTPFAISIAGANRDPLANKNPNEFDIKRVMTEDFYIHRWFMHVFDMPGDQTDTCTNNMIKALRWRKDENIRGMYSINCKF